MGAGSFHSLMQAPRRISSLAISLKKLPTAPTQPPIAIRNKHEVLSENIGCDGQRSTLQMDFGELATIKTQMPRRAKMGTLVSSII